MMGRLRALGESLRSGFWAVPGACVLVALVLGLGLVQVDRVIGGEVGLAFGAGPDGAREVLSAITTSMITFTGLVFSITIVVLQLTSSQFSPRVLRTFLQDRQTQFSLGIFVATFVYAIIVLRTVSSVQGSSFVPAIATTVGMVLLLVSVGVFVAYIHHIATSIQVSSILAAIGGETRRTVEHRYPEDEVEEGLPSDAPRPTGPVAATLPARRQGVITHIDVKRLVHLAGAAGVVLRLPLRLGDFVAEGAALIEVLGDPARLDEDAAVGAVTLGRERTMHQDIAFGLRQLVDIAERALSPGINDPTTAVQALDQVHDVLRRLAGRRLSAGLHPDRSGQVRFVQPPETFAAYLELAVSEVEQYGSDSRQVLQRLISMREELLTAVRPEHRAAVLTWLPGPAPAQT